MKKIITKRLILVSTLLFSFELTAATLSHSEIKTMVEKIKHQRGGIDVATLENSSNPFAIIEKVIEIKEVEKKVVKKKKAKIIKKEVVYNLTAVLNHAAFIDGKWYKVGDKIGQFILVSINDDSVDIKSKNKQKKLSIKKEKRKFILNKGN